MFLHVIEAKYIRDHTLWLRFNDGSAGEVDLSDELDGKVFRLFKDGDYFKTFSVRGYTLSWDNGADFAPEFLQELMVSQGKIASST